MSFVPSQFIPQLPGIVRNFFTQVAPCTNNRLNFGKFKDGVANGVLDTEFNDTCTYKMKPTNGRIRLLRQTPSATNWVLVGLRAT